MIRTELVSTGELHQRDQRLDAAFYCSSGAKARKVLASSSIRLQPLASVCVPEGIYIPHRFKRPYVRDPEYGVPYLTGSDIVLADPLQGCVYLSRRPGMIPDKERLVLHPGTILVTSSGDPGRAVYVNELFAGAIGSPDILRIVPDAARIPPGYLFAFLASEMGRGLLTQGTYGGVIPHIEAFHVLDLPVPRLDGSIELAIHERIDQAAAKRVQANRLLYAADSAFLDLVELPPPPAAAASPLCFVARVTGELSRLDPPHYHPVAEAVRSTLSSHPWHTTLGELTTEIFHPFRMNLRYVEAQNGIPFINGGEIIHMRPHPTKWISRTLYANSRFIVKHGWSLATNAGTIGFHTYVRNALDGFAIAQHVTRFVPDEDIVIPAFLYAIIRNPYTQLQMKALIYGSVVDTVLESHMARVLAACPPKDQQFEIANMIDQAFGLRDEANDLEDEAQDILSRALTEALSVPSPDGHGGA